MPYIRAEAQSDGGAQGSGGEGGENAGDGQSKEQKLVYTAEETAVFSEGAFVALLDRDETFAYNLLCGTVFAGNFTVETDEGKVSLNVLKNDGSAQPDKTATSAQLSVQIRARVYDKDAPSQVGEITQSEILPEEVSQKAEERVKKMILSLWNKCAESDCDLFFLARQLYRRDLPLYREKGGLSPAELSPSVEVSVSGIH